jgi:hypothetical protein
VDPVRGRQQVTLLRPLDEVNGSSASVYLGEIEAEGQRVQVAVKIYRNAAEANVASGERRLTELYTRYDAARRANPSNWVQGGSFNQQEIEQITEILGAWRARGGGADIRPAIRQVAERTEFGRARAAYSVNEVENARILSDLGIGPRVFGFVDTGIPGTNHAFAMERIIGVEGESVTMAQLDSIARARGITRTQATEGVMRSFEEAYTTLLRSGYDIGDFQYAVLTRRQFINGRWREPGEVVFWDPGALRRLPARLTDAEIAQRVGAQSRMQRSIMEGEIWGNYMRTHTGRAGSAIGNAEFQRTVLSLTGRAAFDEHALGAFINLGGDPAQRVRRTVEYIRTLGATDPAAALRAYRAIRQAEVESGVLLLPQAQSYQATLRAAGAP